MILSRTTMSSLTNLVTRTSSRITNELRTLETQAMTGQKFQRYSDDPSNVSESLRLQGLVADQALYQANAGTATSLLDAADTALASVTDVIQRANEIAVMGSSETLDEVGRAAIAIEVEGLQETLTTLANLRIGNRRLFAGETYDADPFDATGVYNGGTDQPSIQVAEGTFVTVGFDGSQVFQGDVDAFKVLSDLQTALESNDVDAVRTSLDDLHTAHNQVVEWRERVGYSTNLAGDAQELALNLESLLAEELNNRAGIDTVEVYAELNELRTAYNAAMQIGATSVSGKLFEYI